MQNLVESFWRAKDNVKVVFKSVTGTRKILPVEQKHYRAEMRNIVEGTEFFTRYF